MLNIVNDTRRERNKSIDVLVSRISFLKDNGVVVKPSAAPEIMGVKNSEHIGYLIGADYDKIEDIIDDIIMSDSVTNFFEYRKNPRIKTKQINHEKTRENFIRDGFTNSKNNIFDAYLYLSRLKHLGVVFDSTKKWSDMLAKDYLTEMKNPFDEIRLASYGKKMISRCLPGWSSSHNNVARYKLSNNWIEDKKIDSAVKNEIKNGLIVTDGLCEECRNSFFIY